jgi:3-polyprenyl-4-hydroxybenzoate decarboxylase
LKALRAAGIETHLVISKAGQITVSHELAMSLSEVAALADVVYKIGDLAAAISSGSFQSSAMLSSPRKPSNTMRIFSSAKNCRRVARRMVLMTCSAGSFAGADFCLIFAPSRATMNQKFSLTQSAKSVS